jgi:hypothetical protein
LVCAIPSRRLREIENVAASASGVIAAVEHPGQKAAAGESGLKPPEADPWEPVSQAHDRAVTVAVRKQDRGALERAIASLADAAQQISS